MFTLHSSIEALRDAEAIVSSKLLREDERTSLMDLLVATLPSIIAPPHVEIVRHAVLRIYRPAEAEEQRRQAEGEQDAPAVAEGSPEAAEGSTEGEQEQAQDDSVVPSGSDAVASTPKAPASPKKPRNGKAR